LNREIEEAARLEGGWLKRQTHEQKVGKGKKRGGAGRLKRDVGEMERGDKEEDVEESKE